MFHIARNITDLNTCIRNYFSTFRADILSLTNTQWNDEDLKGKTLIQYDINRYYSLLYLLVIIYKDYERLGNQKEWSYFVDKYNLNEYKKCLACYNISLDNCLKLFNLQSTDEGIEISLIEQSFIVENQELQPSIISYLDLLSNIGCINNIN